MSQQIELRSPVTLALDELHPVDLAFQLPVGPRESEGGLDGGPVRLDAAHKPHERWQVAPLSILQPGVQRRQVPSLKQFAEPLEEVVAEGELTVLGQELLQEYVLVRLQLVRRLQADPPHRGSPPEPVCPSALLLPLLRWSL